ncbi:hypothetical protein [Protaetiibacter larvae]|uniref:Uncharacterized protein n=1 Tax=Protaetiibacter larvae TaxID=2592654 RepID=A0A5C1Y4S6_9MICO|nr:hypothetical protein [Protaetiibacter larvae]QEO08761.1 hypothetical protein FLP23_01230 [Protaetiibacter larvae]
MLARLDELIKQAPHLSAREAAAWLSAVNTRLASAQRLVDQMSVSTDHSELARYQARIADLTAIAEATAGERDGRRRTRPEKVNPGVPAADVAESRALRGQLLDLLARAENDAIPKTGPQKHEWVMAVNAALATARKHARRAPKTLLAAELSQFTARVDAALERLGAPGKARKPSLAKSSTPAKARTREGVWEVVGGVRHRVSAGRVMMCGVITPNRTKLSAADARDCPDCVARSEHATERKRKKRSWGPRYWTVSGGAPGLGKRR